VARPAPKPHRRRRPSLPLPRRTEGPQPSPAFPEGGCQPKATVAESNRQAKSGSHQASNGAARGPSQNGKPPRPSLPLARLRRKPACQTCCEQPVPNHGKSGAQATLRQQASSNLLATPAPRAATATPAS